MNAAAFITHFFHPRTDDDVRFIVTGSSKEYNITILEPNGLPIQKSTVHKGFKQSFTAHKGDYVYFSAQANNRSSEVHVKILYRGRTFKEATSRGDYAIAQTGGCLC